MLNEHDLEELHEAIAKQNEEAKSWERRCLYTQQRFSEYLKKINEHGAESDKYKDALLRIIETQDEENGKYTNKPSLIAKKALVEYKKHA